MGMLAVVIKSKLHFIQAYNYIYKPMANNR